MNPQKTRTRAQALQHPVAEPKLYKMPVNESAEDKFRRIAGGRMSRALWSIQQLQTLANPTIYEYRQDQIEKMVGDLRREIDRVESAFEHGKPDIPYEI